MVDTRARVLEVADQLFLLGVDGDGRVACGQRRLCLCVDILELRITIRMLRPLEGLAVGLETEAQLLQQLRDAAGADLVAERLKLGGQLVQALGGPAQRRHRIAPGRRVHKALKVGQQRRISLGHRLAPAAMTAHAVLRCRPALTAKLLQRTADRAPSNAGDPGNGGDAARTCATRFSRRQSTPTPLIQERLQRFKPLPDPQFVNHTTILGALTPAGNPLDREKLT